MPLKCFEKEDYKDAFYLDSIVPRDTTLAKSVQLVRTDASFGGWG